MFILPTSGNSPLIDTIMELSNNEAVRLDSRTQSQITTVNLYTDKALITRTYKVNVLRGRTQLRLTYLPTSVDCRTIRVRGRGDTSTKIEDVTGYRLQFDAAPDSSPLLQNLIDKQARAYKTLRRYERTVRLIHDNMKDHTRASKHLDVSNVGGALDVYDALQQTWEGKLTQAEQDHEKISKEIEKERYRLERDDDWLRTNVVIGLSSTKSAELEIVLTYMVFGVSWQAAYNIEVDMQVPGTPVELTYQAVINQNTGEDWKNVSVVLETGRPTHGVDPSDPWFITHYEPPESPPKDPVVVLPMENADSRSSYDCDRGRHMSRNEGASSRFMSVGTAIKVPGLLTILNGEKDHCVQVVDLELEAKISRVCIPKMAKDVSLEAEITNLSKYTLLPGWATVFVDRTFVSCNHVEVPTVLPKEVFKCPLGADTSIRVTYHGLETEPVRAARTGILLKKCFVYAHTQRISIHNTKSTPLYDVRVTDYIPVSTRADISVDLIFPALVLPQLPSKAQKASSLPSGIEFKFSDGVIAMWKGADIEGTPPAGYRDLGKDGMIDWLCDIPAFGRVDLLLQWKVTSNRKEGWVNAFSN